VKDEDETSPPKICPEGTTMNSEGECESVDGDVTPPKVCPVDTTMSSSGECVKDDGTTVPPKVICPDGTTMNANGQCIDDEGNVTPPKTCPQGTTMNADGECIELETDVDDDTTEQDDTQVLGTQVTNTGSGDGPAVADDDRVAPAAAPQGGALALTGGNVLPLVLVALVLLLTGWALLRSRRPTE
jgi:hypothetical protein